MLCTQNATEQSVLFWGDTDLNSKLDKTNQDILVFTSTSITVGPPAYTMLTCHFLIETFEGIRNI